jgi:hypothetical protein
LLSKFSNINSYFFADTISKATVKNSEMDRYKIGKKKGRRDLYNLSKRDGFLWDCLSNKINQANMW